MRHILLLCAISLAIPAFAKDKPTITIQVVSSQASVREFTQTTPATVSKSVTNCDTNGTVNGDSVNASTDCRTTTTPGKPAQTTVTHIPQEHVFAIMPNGDHVTLWCQEGWRRCMSLPVGDYQAEVKGNAAWVYTHELSGRIRKVKYSAVGGW
jgi:hypothetical protein